MLRIVLGFILSLISLKAFSQAVVENIHTSREILVNVNNALGFFEDKQVVIFSKQQEKIIAIGKITDSEINGHPGIVKVQITEIVDNYLIMPDDPVEILNYRLYNEKNIPGFFSLTLNGSSRVPSQFKELAYFGVFTSEGHNLDQNEWLLSLFQVQYGMTDKLTLRMVNALWLDGYANLGLKYRVLTNKFAKITMNALGGFKVEDQDWIGQVGGVITLPYNSKFQSHFMVNATFDPQYARAKNTKDLRLFQDSDIRSITEYIMDNWNRVLYGPVYNVELQTLGGTVSHMWIWNTFHMSLGVATRDFTNLTFAPKGYYYVYDLFWRF